MKRHITDGPKFRLVKSLNNLNAFEVNGTQERRSCIATKLKQYFKEIFGLYAVSEQLAQLKNGTILTLVEKQRKTNFKYMKHLFDKPVSQKTEDNYAIFSDSDRSLWAISCAKKLGEPYELTYSSTELFDAIGLFDPL
jgi:hypothetical protein